MHNPDTCLKIICELRELADLTLEHLHEAKSEISKLQQSNRDSESNIRSLMDENGQLQDQMFKLEEDIRRLKDKYETQRQ